MSAQEKTERATPKRQREARERGELARSRELSSAAVVAAGVAGLLAMSAGIANGAAQWMRGALNFDPALLRDPGTMVAHFGGLLAQGFGLIAPLLLVALIVALLAPMALGGWNFSVKALKLDFGRSNPVKGLGRMFSGQAAMELLKALMKAGVLGAIASIYVLTHRDELHLLARQAVQPAMAQALDLAFGSLIWLCGGLLLIAGIDVPWQLYAHAKKLKMSRQEVKEEHKQAEGSPEVKGRIRRLQQEIANRRMMEKLPTADVVVVNPTHYAVALKYEAGKMRAPRVIAKGVDLVALTIREKAKEHRIPILSAPPLARALYRGAELDQEIPVALYAAVAQVLTYIYQLRQQVAGVVPTPPEIGDVPGGEADPVPGR